MKKRILACLLAAMLLTGAAGCRTSQPQNNSVGSTETTDTSTVGMSFFSDSDYKDVSSQPADAEITLSGSEGTISDNTRGTSGKTVTVTSKGIYRVTGSSSDVNIEISDSKESGTVYLVLDSAVMTNGSAPCIYVSSADKVVIQCVGKSTLTYTGTDQKQDAAIYAKDDITVNGSGSLDIISSDKGIVCSDDLKITGSTLSINAGTVGIKSKKTVRIGGGNTVINAAHDGIQTASDEENVYFRMEDGVLTVNAGYDGIDVSADGFESETYLEGGSITIISGGGSDRADEYEKSCKGIRCGGNILFGGADVSVSSADDAVNSKKNVIITSGNVTLASGDDAIHADNSFEIKEGKLTVEKAYEGIEAAEAVFTGGETAVTASDDGVNASEGIVNVLGGKLYVNCGGDGLDANGSIFVKGGEVIIEASTGDGNGALDKGDGEGCVLSVTGGKVLALGSAAKAANFDDGTQCSALLKLSGESGTVISTSDGFTYTATKPFSSVVYSSPEMRQGNSYTIKAGTESSTADFSSGLYFSE